MSGGFLISQFVMFLTVVLILWLGFVRVCLFCVRNFGLCDRISQLYCQIRTFVAML